MSDVAPPQQRLVTAQRMRNQLLKLVSYSPSHNHRSSRRPQCQRRASHSFTRFCLHPCAKHPSRVTCRGQADRSSAPPPRGVRLPRNPSAMAKQTSRRPISQEPKALLPCCLANRLPRMPKPCRNQQRKISILLRQSTLLLQRSLCVLHRCLNRRCWMRRNRNLRLLPRLLLACLTPTPWRLS
jgi:hypothetical protein